MIATTAVHVPLAIRPSAVDVRPIIPRNRTNLWSGAEQVRDELYERLAAAFAREGVEPLLLKSGPNVFPAWVRFEVWRPKGETAVTQRSSALVTIEPRPYHTHEFEFEVSYTRDTKARTVKRVAQVGDAELQALITHLTREGPKPRFRRFREAGFQLWREKNEIRMLKKDWLATVAGLCMAAGLFALTLPPLALVFWAVGIVLYLKITGRKALVRNEGKPDSEPRTLVRVDSWQTVLFHLGAEEAMVRERFLRALQTGLGKHCRFHTERVWYWGLDGKEEREQWVLTTNRAIVFCQIYRYGEDLYVGWDGHLNRGQWVEQSVGSGIDRASGDPLTIMRVVPGTQPTTEYDLSDLSCLMEWTHAQLVKLLKQLLDEKKIDQEIDFKIQRAERGAVVRSGEASAEGGAAGKIRKAFQRTA